MPYKDPEKRKACMKEYDAKRSKDQKRKAYLAERYY